MKLLFSIVIPTYGREFDLYRALDSLVSQTYKNFEVLIVDDNSKNLDLRKKIEKELFKYSKSLKIKYIKNEKNLGGAETRNKGIINSNGEYIVFLDDDDTFFPEKLEKIYQNLKNQEKYDFIYNFCEARSTKTNKKICEYKNPINSEENKIFKHLCSNICATSQMVVRKEILEKVNYFENVKAKQDYILILKILGLPNIRVKCIEEILSTYYEEGNERISTASLKRIKYEKQAMKFSRKYIKELSDKEKEIVNLYYLKRLFGISYLMEDKKRMKYYIKKIIKYELPSKEIIKYILGKKVNKIKYLLRR